MSLDVRQLSLGPIGTNCYLVRRPGAAEAVLVDPGADAVTIRFEPDERRSVSSAGGAKILLLLAPWPGPGHYRGEEKALSA